MKDLFSDITSNNNPDTIITLYKNISDMLNNTCLAWQHFNSKDISLYWKYAIEKRLFFTIETSNITGIISNLIAAGIYSKENIYDALLCHVEAVPETIENAMINYLKVDSSIIQLVDNYINWLSPWDLYDGIKINLIIHCIDDNITDISTLINEYESM